MEQLSILSWIYWKRFKKYDTKKIIQAFGRVGRQGAFGDYSIRIRDNGIINKLFFKRKQNGGYKYE